MKLGRLAQTLGVGALVLSGLSACGIVYTSPSVSDGSAFGDNGSDLNVEIIPLTYESAVAANLTPYVPARLPLGFQPDAAQRIVASKGISIPDFGPLPAVPTQAGARPGFVPDNLPPIEPPRPYMIGIADVLLLSVNGTTATLDALPGLISAQSKRQGFVVQDDGAIAIPDAGRVRVAGLTLQDAEAEIFQTLVSSGIDPSFSLEIAEFNSQRVSVGGQVRQPTLVPITLKPLYLHEAVNAAGGLAVIDTDVAKIQLFRSGRSFQISSRRFVNDPAVRQIVLRDGDSIYVGSDFNEERARNSFLEQLQLRQQQQSQVNLRLQTAAARAQLETDRQSLADARIASERSLFKDRLELGAVKRDYAYLAGEVVLPKRVELPFETKSNLADVLFSERGLNINFADYSEIYVLRRAKNPAEFGSVSAYHLDAENAANLALADVFEIHAGDIVFVAEQPITAWNRALSQTLPTLFTSLANAASGF
ncbi:MAG: polysaccharide biosynthesis/export family protein [Pseudomonadota bacterium]